MLEHKKESAKLQNRDPRRMAQTMISKFSGYFICTRYYTFVCTYLSIVICLRQVLLLFVFHLGLVRGRVGTLDSDPRTKLLPTLLPHLPNGRGLFNFLPHQIEDFLGSVVSIMLFINISVFWASRKMVPSYPL